MAETPPTDFGRKKIFTTGEAAQVCKVSQQTIIRCFDSGRLTGFRVPGSKFRRIPREELIRFMNANDIPLDLIEGGTKRILCVDDDPEIIELLRDILGDDARFEIETCGTGYEAGLLTASFKPNLILLDFKLPDINGNEVCKRIRSTEDLSGIRVVFISGVIDRAEADKLIEAGADGFIKKPFDVPHLMGMVESLLGMESRHRDNGVNH